MTLQQWLTVAKDLFTILAALGALAFFTYKGFAGWLLINLSVAIAPTREQDSDNPSKAHLVVKISLGKGKIDGLRLLGGEVRLLRINGSSAVEVSRRQLRGIRRMKVNITPRMRPARSDDLQCDFLWDEMDGTNRILTISPEETMEVAEHFLVDASGVYRIEVVISGDRMSPAFLNSLSQWRSAAVSLP